MARITVDDCIKFFPNRFELTLAATNRARQIALGATPLVEAQQGQAHRDRAARDRRGQGRQGAAEPAGADAAGPLKNGVRHQFSRCLTPDRCLPSASTERPLVA